MSALDVIEGRAQWAIAQGDVLERLADLPDESVNCVVTSPPYWGLRDYGVAGQIGLEPTPDAYVARLVAVFREVRRVLRSDGTCWVNLGDSYNSNPSWGRGKSTLEGRPQDAIPSKPAGGWLNHARTDTLKTKDLVGIPWRVAFALQADGWWLRSDVIWSKPNPMPESVTDRPTRSHEYLFLLTKAARYWYDADAIREPMAEASADRYGYAFGGAKSEALVAADKDGMGVRTRPVGFRDMTAGRNKRTVWTIATEPFSFDRVSRAGYGGSGRTVSPDCPVHGERSRSASTARRGERPGASDPGRSPRTDDRPEQSPLAERAPTETPHDGRSSPGSSDSQPPECGQIAMPRSTGSRRTDPDRSTSPRATGGDESSHRTGDTTPRPDSDATSDRIPESSNAADSDADERGSDPSGRSFDRSSDKCTCQIIDHFAVFPTALVEPCVLAGCPVGGVCLDPFAGSGTTLLVALRHGRRGIGIELNERYVEMASRRIFLDCPMFNDSHYPKGTSGDFSGVSA